MAWWRDVQHLLADQARDLVPSIESEARNPDTMLLARPMWHRPRSTLTIARICCFIVFLFSFLCPSSRGSRKGGVTGSRLCKPLSQVFCPARSGLGRRLHVSDCPWAYGRLRVAKFTPRCSCCRFASGAGPEDAEDDWRHEWEIDPATLEIGPKVGEGEFGTVHKVR